MAFITVSLVTGGLDSTFDIALPDYSGTQGELYQKLVLRVIGQCVGSLFDPDIRSSERS